MLATRRVFDSSGNQTSVNIADSNPVSKESIIRLEFDWSGTSDHAIQVNMEGAINSLENSLVQTRDTGSGPAIVDVPDANTRVEEVRGDFQIKDIWEIGQFEFDYGIGAEVSTIKQNGDSEQERSFFFMKPQGVVTYSPGKNNQTRLRLAREVSQLDFNDFVSATIFEDNDLFLGNPDLRPETTWKSEFSHELRFGQDSVVEILLFYHWIKNVEDLLPLADTFEVPGNIGKGNRWGIEFESTLPLERLGLTGAKLDIKARWQDSSVTDPVTGEKRILSANGGFAGPPSFKFNSENKYTYDFSYRQDFEEQRYAWGIEVAQHANRPLFRVDELDVYHEGFLLNTFVETTRWFGIKINLVASNILDYRETRDHTVYTAKRDLSPIDYYLERSRTPGRRLTLTLSGSF